MCNQRNISEELESKETELKQKATVVGTLNSINKEIEENRKEENSLLRKIQTFENNMKMLKTQNEQTSIALRDIEIKAHLEKMKGNSNLIL